MIGQLVGLDVSLSFLFTQTPREPPERHTHRHHHQTPSLTLKHSSKKEWQMKETDRQTERMSGHALSGLIAFQGSVDVSAAVSVLLRASASNDGDILASDADKSSADEDFDGIT